MTQADVAEVEVVEEAKPIVVQVVIANEVKTWEGLKAEATRKARSYIRGQGLSIRNAPSNTTDPETGNITISWPDPSPKMLEKAAKAQAEAEAQKAQAEEEAQAVEAQQEGAGGEESWE